MAIKCRGPLGLKLSHLGFKRPHLGFRLSHLGFSFQDLICILPIRSGQAFVHVGRILLRPRCKGHLSRSLPSPSSTPCLFPPACLRVSRPAGAGAEAGGAGRSRQEQKQEEEEEGSASEYGVS